MEHVTWYVVRSAGVTAYVLLFLVTATGLMLSGPAAAWWRGIPVLGLHRFLTYLATGFLAIHILVLLVDSYLRFSLAELLIPFVARFEPWWTGVGIVAMYLLAVVVITTEGRRYFQTTTWYAIHLTSYVAFVFATAHGIMTGSDTQTSWLFAMYLACGALTWLLFIERFVSARAPFGQGVLRWLPGAFAGGSFLVMVMALLTARAR